MPSGLHNKYRSLWKFIIGPGSILPIHVPQLFSNSLGSAILKSLCLFVAVVKQGVYLNWPAPTVSAVSLKLPVSLNWVVRVNIPI